LAKLSISPESSDGFASVGTILPKEEVTLLPGGLFVFAMKVLPICGCGFTIKFFQGFAGCNLPPVRTRHLRAIGCHLVLVRRRLNMGSADLNLFYSGCARRISSMRRLGLSVAIALLAVGVATAQDVKVGVTYVCNGERMFAESCNMRDVSDTSTCMVGDPDQIQANGMMQYTTLTRGALKKLFPTCTQPSAKELAAVDAMHQKQQAIQNANEVKATQQLNAAAQAQSRTSGNGQVQPPKNAEERAMRRCVSSGRLPSSCTGNSLLGMFGQMLNSVLPSGGADKGPTSGPNMAGMFQGAGG
jgi:hypothetical protein